MTAIAEPVETLRPPVPKRASRFAIPIVVFAVVVALTGYAGEMGPLWGALVGAATFALFWQVGMSRSLFDAGTLVVVGAVGFSLFNLAIAGRDTGVTYGIAFQASLGIAVFGLAAGWVVLRHAPGLKPTTVLLSGAAWGGGAYLALLTAVAMGFLDRIVSGQVQEITFAMFIAVSLTAGLIGASANLAFWSGLPVVFASTFVFLVSTLAWNEIGFSIVEVWTQFTRIGEFLGEFWPPDFFWPRSVGQ
ncbi:MAG: hypothetical protein KDB69_02000, partial [Acidimicrobiia bacterium]|nr:hypothetical protein [Acidimicrobiia bacterium]